MCLLLLLLLESKRVVGADPRLLNNNTARLRLPVPQGTDISKGILAIVPVCKQVCKVGVVLICTRRHFGGGTRI